MVDPTLVIGNKNYSSWSLRPWLLLTHAGIGFVERQIWLYTDEGRAALRELSPSAKVPVFHDGDIAVWESLAICEHVAERYADHSLWPKHPAARAHARSVSAEMHAGFHDLRNSMPMNCRRVPKPIDHGPGLRGDIDRVFTALSEARTRYGGSGPFLYGSFSVADAMFAPVAIRFAGYAVDPPEPVGAWMVHLLGLEAMQSWIRAGRAETATLEEYDVD